MSKLDDTFTKYRDLFGKGAFVVGRAEAKEEVRNLFLELIGDVESRETTDMTLKTWTSEDYKAFGKNELKIELMRKVAEL